jgi:hypothetical protein
LAIVPRLLVFFIRGASSSRCSAARRQRGRSRRARSRRAHANRESSHGDCRKTGDLPLDICAEDDSRTTIGLQREPDESDPRDHAQGWVDYLREDMPNSYRPFVFWDDQKSLCRGRGRKARPAQFVRERLRRVLRPDQQSDRLR